MQTNLQTEASKLFAAVANCSKQVANQNTNVAAEVCKVTGKENIRFDRRHYCLYLYLVLGTSFLLFGTVSPY